MQQAMTSTTTTTTTTLSPTRTTNNEPTTTTTTTSSPITNNKTPRKKSTGGGGRKSSTVSMSASSPSLLTSSSSSPQKPTNQRGDRLDNLVDSLSHIYCTDNETRSHKFPPKYDNMIVPEQMKTSRQRQGSSTSLVLAANSSLVTDSNETVNQIEDADEKTTTVTKKKPARSRAGSKRVEEEQQQPIEEVDMAPRKKRWSMVVDTSMQSANVTMSPKVQRVQKLAPKPINEALNNNEHEEEAESKSKTDSSESSSSLLRPRSGRGPANTSIIQTSTTTPRHTGRVSAVAVDTESTEATTTPRKAGTSANQTGTNKKNRRKSMLPAAGLVDVSEQLEAAAAVPQQPPIQLPEGNY